MAKKAGNKLTNKVAGKFIKSAGKAAEHEALAASKAARNVQLGLLRDLFSDLYLPVTKKPGVPPVKVNGRDYLPVNRGSSQLVPRQNKARVTRALPSSNMEVKVIDARPNRLKESPIAQLRREAVDAQIVRRPYESPTSTVIPLVNRDAPRVSRGRYESPTSKIISIEGGSLDGVDNALDKILKRARLYNLLTGLGLVGASAGLYGNYLNDEYNNRKQELANPKLLDFDDSSKYVQSSDGSVYDKNTGELVANIHHWEGDNVFDAMGKMYNLEDPDEIRKTQRELGVADDGIVGIQTMNALRKRAAQRRADNYSFWDFLNGN